MRVTVEGLVIQLKEIVDSEGFAYGCGSCRCGGRLGGRGGGEGLRVVRARLRVPSRIALSVGPDNGRGWARVWPRRSLPCGARRRRRFA